MSRSYGWKRPEKNEEQKLYCLRLFGDHEALPPKVDLRNEQSPVVDQGKLSSCVANAISALVEYMQRREGQAEAFFTSRLMLYYCARELDNPNALDRDEGATIQSGFKALQNVGVCKESMWPYDIRKYAIRPSKECFEFAHQHRCVLWHSVIQDIQQIKLLHSQGFLIVFGMEVFPEFESDHVRTVSTPNSNEKSIARHAVLSVGYDDDHDCGKDGKGACIVRNSWGPSWGDQGYFYLPYRFMTDPKLCSEFFTLKIVSRKKTVDIRDLLRRYYGQHQSPEKHKPDPSRRHSL